MAVYAVSDIHGHYDLFMKGLSEICFSEQDHLWCLGDAIDRGPDGIRILQEIMKQPNIDLILGNHEFMMLNSVDPEGEAKCTGTDSTLWLYPNGGEEAFAKYKRLSYGDRIDLLSWLITKYVIKTIEIDGRPICLTHSFYKETCENKSYCDLSYSDVWNVTWSSIWREDSYTHAMDIYSNYEYMFVSGHVPVQRVRRWFDNTKDWNKLKAVEHNNLINIDGGCSFGYQSDLNNGLIIYRLDDMEEFHIEMTE